MKTRRLHITGASGAGTTTLGRALASALAVPHFDADDFYWLPTEPPFRTARPKADRLRLMDEMFLPRAGWVLSGSALGWGDLNARLDLVVFLTAPTQLRIARLRDREARLFGAQAVEPGGSHYAQTQAFLDWAASYDVGGNEGRSLGSQLAALEALACPVLRLDGAAPTCELLPPIFAALTQAGDGNPAPPA